MLVSVTASAGHPVVAALLGLGAAGLAGAVVAMAWSVHIHQFRLAELLARRQFALAAGTGPAAAGPAAGRRRGTARRCRAVGAAGAAAGTAPGGAAGAAAGTTPGGAAGQPRAPRPAGPPGLRPRRRHPRS